MDNWIEISKYIPKGSWKNFVFTCKSFYSLNTEKEIRKRKKTPPLFIPLKFWLTSNNSEIKLPLENLSNIYI